MLFAVSVSPASVFNVFFYSNFDYPTILPLFSLILTSFSFLLLWTNKNTAPATKAAKPTLPITIPAIAPVLNFEDYGQEEPPEDEQSTTWVSFIKANEEPMTSKPCNL